MITTKASNRQTVTYKEINYHCFWDGHVMDSQNLRIYDSAGARTNHLCDDIRFLALLIATYTYRDHARKKTA
ncbi:MAG: hypothetical protein WEA58_04115 [Balneolaceae bacterium]